MKIKSFYLKNHAKTGGELPALAGFT